ncbi:RCC1 domain-containing protein [[Clostridium] innocuum]|nr:RCC1 domain-containing protein [[Clostridium] innocuum]
MISIEILDKKENFGQTEIADWNNVVQISAGWLRTVALTQDGHILYTEINKNFISNFQLSA